MVSGPDAVGEPRSVFDVRPLEARAVARRARELVDAGRKPSEMAILLTAWSGMEALRPALRAVGIETYALRSEGFYKRRETVDLLLALEAMNDPNDDRALMGFLRSPFVGLKDETLLQIARAAHTPYWRELAGVKVGEQERLDRGRALLERHVRLRDRVPADTLLEGLLAETGYVAHLRLLGEEKRRAEANVRKFVRLLRRQRATTVGEAIRAIRVQRSSEEAREGDAPLAGGARNAVTVTSVHSAKGLEWPIVFWCDLTRLGGADSDQLIVARDAMALKPASERKEDRVLYDSLKKAERAEHAAEAKRLWYVAATRARELLVLSGIPLGSGKRDAAPAHAFHERLGLASLAGEGRFAYADRDGVAYEGTLRLAPVLEAEPPAELALPSGVAAAVTLPVPLAPIAVPSGRRRHSATELLTFARCRRRHWFRYVAGLAEPEVERSGAEFISALKRGQIVHDVLHQLREDEELDALLEAAIGRWDPEAPPPEGRTGGRYREHLREEVERVAGHPQYRAIADLPTARRELEFTHLLPDEGGGASGAFTSGAMDLAALRLDGLVLLDVKTSQMSAADAKKRAADYAPQRDVYVAAAEAISGLPVAEYALQFSRAATQVAEALTPEKRAAIATEMKSALGAIESGDRPLTAHAGECRWCGYRKAGWCPGIGEAPSP